MKFSNIKYPQSTYVFQGHLAVFVTIELKISEKLRCIPLHFLPHHTAYMVYNIIEIFVLGSKRCDVTIFSTI